MRHRAAILLAVLLLLPLAPARAAEPSSSCVPAYEKAARPYWTVVNDIQTFKAMFDNYDRLCTAYFPQTVAAFPDEAALLRRQIRRDATSAATVMSRIFDEVLPANVSSPCANDARARKAVKRSFLKAMDRQSSFIKKRLNRSLREMPAAAKDLKICGDLQTLVPKVRKALGPELARPLLKMASLNRHPAPLSRKERKTALGAYRRMLDCVDGVERACPAK